MLKKFINNFFKKTDNNILLGRWGNHGANIKNLYANHDHCGDIICKTPLEVKNCINNEITLLKKNKK